MGMMMLGLFFRSSPIVVGGIGGIVSRPWIVERTVPHTEIL